MYRLLQHKNLPAMQFDNLLIILGKSRVSHISLFL